jgi:hypothetical protein
LKNERKITVGTIFPINVKHYSYPEENKINTLYNTTFALIKQNLYPNIPFSSSQRSPSPLSLKAEKA